MFILIKRNAPKRYTTEYCNIRNAISKVMNHYFEYNEFPAPNGDINEESEKYIEQLTKERDIDYISLYVRHVVQRVYFNNNKDLVHILMGETELGNALSAINQYIKTTNGKISYEVYVNTEYGKGVK